MVTVCSVGGDKRFVDHGPFALMPRNDDKASAPPMPAAGSARSTAIRRMIPKVLHYVWVGPDPMPADQRSWVQGWRELMPGWKICHWGNGDIDWNVPFLRQA